ncbi:MAG TPA: EAL domain-containing protein [Gallionella sp.]|nr:EAL domain-containing protein [Gallionella sp.]
MPRNWFGKTIARKLLLAFFFIFIITYLVTALVVQSAVRSAVTDSELATLSQLAHLKLGSFNAKIEEMAVDLHAWTKLDVMNDLASGDVDKRVERTLENLRNDYALKGQLYAFNAAGYMVASSDQQQNKVLLPDAWKPHGQINFVNKHTNPLDNDEIVALVAPVAATFSSNYQLGTLVLVYRWGEVRAALPGQTLLFHHQDLAAPQESMPNAAVPIKPLSNLDHHESLTLLESTLGITVPNESLPDLAHLKGWVTVGNGQYLVSNASENSGLLSGWEVVMLREPEALYQNVHMVILKLAILGMILSLPLIFSIRWLAGRLTAPLRELTQFVSEITGTHDLSKRLELHSNDEIGILATDFNHMTARLASGLEANREAEARLRATIDNALDAVVKMDSEGIIIGWNVQAENIFGWTREEAVGRELHETIIPPRYREAHVHGLKRYLLTSKKHIINSRVEVVGIHRDGREFPVELAITSIVMAGKEEFNAFIRDITDKKESEELIWKQANYDKVTGLPNRHMFHDRLEQEIKKAHRANLQMVLLFIDLDRFKEINDTLGHDMGDILLMEASRRINSCIRESDTVARLGGDEFTVILSEVGEQKIVERIATCILKILAEPFQLEDEVAYISASIGITLYPDDATNLEDLLKNADQAMYVAKNKGRNQSCYFTHALQEVAQERRRLAHDLRGALAAKQYMVYFQPIINLATGRIHKAEALIRWQHPERGLIGPTEFILLAEETGLIIGIGDWVFKESARWAKRWRDQYANDFQISVNVSPVQFLSEELCCDAWGAHLQGIGLTGQNIVIEITEGLLLKAAVGVTNKLLSFRDAGIQVAIDDFGTGYSSLSYLKKFDIDYLKIDKSFVDNLETDINDVALSEAIIVMAHKLGLKVIAEGVETEAQLEILSNAGCDYAQGHLFSRPVPPEAFEELLKVST